MKKFNTKTYLGKNRIERAIASETGVYKIWVWSKTKLEYQPPLRGNSYVAIRKRQGTSEKKTFETLEQVRHWKSDNTLAEPIANSKVTKAHSKTFKSLVEDFERKRIPQLRDSTQESYRKLLKVYLSYFNGLSVAEITSDAVDQWIEHLKTMKITARRISFRHELELLSGVLKFYSETDDDFRSPIRGRHRRDIILNNKVEAKNRHLELDEFNRFLQALRELSGESFAAMATVQYFQALRLSEVCGLKWEDIKWNSARPDQTKMVVSRSVFFSRTKGKKPTLQESFKNGKGIGFKTSPLFKEAYQALKALKGTAQGLIFTQPDGELLTYRMIQHGYDTAFAKAGLECRISSKVYHLISTIVYQSISAMVYHPISWSSVPLNA